MNKLNKTTCRGDLDLCYMELVHMSKISEAELAQFRMWADLTSNLDISLMERGRAYELCVQMYDKYAYSWWERHDKFVFISSIVFSLLVLTLAIGIA